MAAWIGHHIVDAEAALLRDEQAKDADAERQVPDVAPGGLIDAAGDEARHHARRVPTMPSAA